MAQACETCGGVGRGSIDEEFGWRRGNKSGQPVVCPVCQGRLDERFENGEWDTTDPKTGKVTKFKGDKPELGPYKDAQARKTSRQAVDVVGGGTYDPGAEEFDPGAVNTGREMVTIDEALAGAGAEQG